MHAVNAGQSLQNAVLPTPTGKDSWPQDVERNGLAPDAGPGGFAPLVRRVAASARGPTRLPSTPACARLNLSDIVHLINPLLCAGSVVSRSHGGQAGTQLGRGAT